MQMIRPWSHRLTTLRGDIWANQSTLTFQILLKCVCQVRKLSSHVYVCLSTDFASSLFDSEVFSFDYLIIYIISVVILFFYPKAINSVSVVVFLLCICKLQMWERIKCFRFLSEIVGCHCLMCIYNCEFTRDDILRYTIEYAVEEQTRKYYNFPVRGILKIQGR